ncbi:MAG TPA: proton-conducting transporter membrane subunit [bacterium]|nr:proton-conducting transporter membrane subunit [bacterium]HOM26235.1 proton-conducting transporter membrane subunit [bacterium]
MEKIVLSIFSVGFISGILCRIIPSRIKYLKEIISGLVSLLFLSFSILLFKGSPYYITEIFLIDPLSIFISIFISLFTLLVLIYSFSYLENFENSNRYYAYILWTLSSSIGAIFSNNLVLFSVFWGFLAITLYLILSIFGQENAYSAKKTMIIVGGSDSFLIFGICGLIYLTGKYTITDMNIFIASGLEIGIFFSLICASFAKAGCMPFHTWIPEIAENTPSPILAYLPASLDKLLGIYLFSRILLNIFEYSNDLHSGLWFILRLIGSLTIVCAVLMAIVQHNMKKLLSYHAISQVGYMVLGIASTNPAGIIGGLFHMLNNSIYKSLLFFGAGNVEKKTKEVELEKLGGLSRFMPITFITFLIGSLSISGVPPFNGFFSKYLIYQGLFEGAKTGDFSWNIWIICGMIGSALTLASFLKIVHSVFLGHIKEYKEKIEEVGFLMLLPVIVLSLLCILFGFGFLYPVKIFENSIGIFIEKGYDYLLPTLTLIFISLIFGLIIFLIFLPSRKRTVSTFIGGEKKLKEMEMSGTEFYKTIEKQPFLTKMYEGAKKKIFDLYEDGKRIVFYLGEGIRATHTGVLPTYLTWILIGCIVLFVLFIKF